MAQICWAVLAAWRCRVTPVAWRFTGLHSFTISCGPLSLNCSRLPEAPEGKPRWVITVRAGNYCWLAEILTAVQRMHRGRRPVRPPADNKLVKTLKGDFNSGRCRVHFEYYSLTTQTWLFSWSKHLHPLSDCYSHLAYQLFNFSKNRFQPFEEKCLRVNYRAVESLHLPMRSMKIKEIYPMVAKNENMSHSISNPHSTFTAIFFKCNTVASAWWDRWRAWEFLFTCRRWNAPAAAASHTSYISEFTVFNKQHSQGLNVPNALVKRFINVCISNFPSQDRLKSLCSQGGLPRRDTPCLPDLMSHSSKYVSVLQLRAATHWWSSLAGEPSQVQHIPTREEAFCLHPHLDFSLTTARVESANPNWSERQR